MTTITTIDAVIKKLDEIISDARQTNSRQGYFAALYRRMTIAVQQGINENRFKDAARMEMLDVIFAKRYLDAYENYRNKLPVTSGWKTAFDACNNNNLTVLQHLILGVNTHINLDLSIAAAETAPGEKVLDMQYDYEQINDIIASLTGEVQDKLTKVWWPLRLLRNIANNKQDAVINFSITAARKAAWANAIALANETDGQKNNHIHTIDQTVTGLANGIIDPGFFVNMLLKAVRFFENKDIGKNITLIS